ncbi:MAG TPA: SRPBCC family protein [Vicinamibacterales bacterium]
MAREFSTSIDIAAPPPIVWEVMSDVERWHEWTASITRVERLDGGPMGIGSRAKVRQPKLPVAFWKVNDWQPNVGFSWVNRAPGLRVTGKHYVAAIPGGSRATLGLHMEGLFAPVLAWLTAGITERYIAMEAAGLKTRSEERARRG